MIKLVFLLMLMTAAGAALAQQPGWEDSGEIPDVKIEITKERQITLPGANRNF